MSNTTILKLIIRDDEGEAIYPISLEGFDLAKTDDAAAVIRIIRELISNDEVMR